MSDKLTDKKIILYGECLWCRNFYDQYADYYKIVGIVYTEQKEEGDKFFEGVSIDIYQKKSYLFEYSADIKIVVCPGDCKKEEHDAFLYSKGYIYGKDYVDSIYAEFYAKRELKKHIEEKEIWIFGAGNNGKLFHEKHCKNMNIKGFLSNYENEELCMGLPVHRPEDVLGKDSIFIIICSAVENEMINQLKRCGLNEFEEFVTSKWFGKRLFIAWGACQVYSIVNMLYKNHQFCNEFCRVSIFDSKIQKCNHADKQRIYTYGEVCDVLFYNSEGMVDTNKAIVDRYYRDSNVYSIPFYSFQGQLMQVTEECSEYSLRYENIKSHFAYWFIGDAEIEKMLNHNLSKEEILEKISREDYWDENRIKKKWVLEKRKIAMFDKLSSLKVSDFLQKNYRDIIVFKDGIHFCKELCMELANQLAGILKLEEIDEEQQRQILKECCVEDTNMMPIYPSIIKVLDMNKSYYDKKYEFVHPNGEVEELDFVAYMEKYIDYVQHVNDLWMKCGTRII